MVEEAPGPAVLPLWDVLVRRCMHSAHRGRRIGMASQSSGPPVPRLPSFQNAHEPFWCTIIRPVINVTYTPSSILGPLPGGESIYSYGNDPQRNSSFGPLRFRPVGRVLCRWFTLRSSCMHLSRLWDVFQGPHRSHSNCFPTHRCYAAGCLLCTWRPLTSGEMSLRPVFFNCTHLHVAANTFVQNM